MPSTIRLLARAAVAVALVWACMWMLATLVDPVPREIVVNVPVDQPQPLPSQTARTAP
jgi:hypothetical protein